MHICMALVRSYPIAFLMYNYINMGQHKTWTLDSGLDHGPDSGLNNGLNIWTRISIARGQR